MMKTSVHHEARAGQMALEVIQPQGISLELSLPSHVTPGSASGSLFEKHFIRMRCFLSCVLC